MAELKLYTFFKHDGGSVPPVVELGEFATDEEAAVHARQLLRESPRYTAIEVWGGGGEPFTIERSDWRNDRTSQL
jgi:hypothetical protein